MKTRNAEAGFSLIELMVTVLVVAILVSIAVPTYMNSVRKTRRTEARSALVDLQAREERYYTINPSSGYTSLAANVGYAASGATTDLSSTAVPIGTSGYYQVQMTAGPVAATTTAPPSYTLTATALADQLKDTACRTLTLDSTGVQGATDSTGASSATVAANCWK